MHRSKAQLFKEALELDDRDKADLAGVLLDSLDAIEHGDAQELWLKEVEKRISEMDSNPQIRIPWATVAEELRKRVNTRV